MPTTESNGRRLTGRGGTEGQPLSRAGGGNRGGGTCGVVSSSPPQRYSWRPMGVETTSRLRHFNTAVNRESTFPIFNFVCSSLLRAILVRDR